MPKRKHNDDKYEKLRKKLKKIEEELLCNTTKKRHRRIISSSSDSSHDSTQQCSEIEDHELSNSMTVPEPDDTVPNELAPDAATGSLLDAGTSGDCTTQPATEADPGALEGNVSSLDSDIIEILGVDPTNTNKYGKDLQKDLAIRFEHIAINGLSRETRKDLLEKYLVPCNCKLSQAPALNLEVKAALSETVIKRDKAIETKQKLTAAAVSSLGEAITCLLSSKDKNTEIIRLLMDTGRMLCDSQHNDSLTRRNYVTTSVKKEMKESLQNTKIDGLLFGSNLFDTLKTAKAIHKSGAELKAPPSKPVFNKNVTPSTSKNWKTPAARKVVPPSTKAASTPATAKSQHAGSSRPSNSQRSSRSRR